MKKQESIIKPINKWYKKLNHTDKRILWVFLSVCFISLLISMNISFIREFDNDLSQTECNKKIGDSINYVLSLQEQNPYLAFLYAWYVPIKLMLIAIGIAWVLHGVGFHIIKR